MKLPKLAPKLVIAATCGSMATAAFAEASFNGVEQTAEIDCDGGTATIEGTDNTLTVTGSCKRLVIQGVDNRVRVDMAAKGVIEVSGVDNQIDWTTPDGSKPQARVSGPGNRITKAR